MAILKKAKTFEALKKKVQEQSQGSSFVDKDEVKWEVGKTYLFRLLFREEDEDSTFNWPEDLNTTDGFIKRIAHGCKDAAGKYMDVVCPVTLYPGKQGYGMCPTCSDLPQMWKDNNPLYGKVKRKENIYAHVYVVKDPVTPENEGHVKKMWVPKSMYTKLKLDIWGVDERYVKEGEELEEVDTSNTYGEEAFLLEDGFNLQVKIIEKTIPDPKNPNEKKKVREYVASFVKDRSTLDVDEDKLVDEMEALKLGEKFIPASPEKLDEFYNRCVLGNTDTPSAPEGDNVDNIVDEVADEPETPKAEVKEKKSPALKKGRDKAKKKPEEKVEEKVEEPADEADQIDMGETEEPESSDDGVDDMDDLGDIDIDDIMSEMNLDDDDE